MSIERLTDSDDGTTWVDQVPGPVESGYTAQNTNISARTRGLDSTTVEAVGPEIVRIKQGGIVDVDGVPYIIGADEDLALTTTDEVQYIAMTDDTATTKVAAVVAGPVTWNAAKNVFETAGGDRVLDWRISAKGGQAVATRISTPPDSARETAPGGISLGGEYVIAEAGTHEVPVMHSGLYEVFAIGGGSPGGGGTVGTDGGGGGGCGAAHVRLVQGETLTVTLAAGGDTSIVLNTVFSVTGTAASDRSGGSGSVSGTRGRVWDNTTTGGDGGAGFGGTSPTAGGHGGGAGPRNAGLDTEVNNGAMTASRFEGAGEGGYASMGAAVIKYRGV